MTSLKLTPEQYCRWKEFRKNVQKNRTYNRLDRNSPEVVAKIQELFKKGYSTRRIARELEIGVSTVHKYKEAVI